jgi:hypothetical protein
MKKIYEVIATGVRFSTDMVYIRLLNGREIGAQLELFPKLRDATREQRTKWRLIGKGIGIRWEYIDEDISVGPLLIKQT